jgi:hypothetical protein
VIGQDGRIVVFQREVANGANDLAVTGSIWYETVRRGAGSVAVGHASGVAALPSAVLICVRVGLAMTDDAPPEVRPKPYRVLLLDAAGRVLRTKAITARDEVEALGRARAFMDGRSVELWEGDRLVHHLAASDTSLA